MDAFISLKNGFQSKKVLEKFAVSKKNTTFALLLKTEAHMVAVVQLVRASDCGSECRGFEPHRPPAQKESK